MNRNINNLSVQDDRRSERAEQVELLRLRLGLLEEPERVLAEFYLGGEVTCVQLARLSGQSVRRMRRRVKGLIRRLGRDDYIFFLRQPRRFDQRQLEVAYDHYLLGMGYRRIAEKRRLSPAWTRRTLAELQGALKPCG